MLGEALDRIARGATGAGAYPLDCHRATGGWSLRRVHTSDAHLDGVEPGARRDGERLAILATE